MQDIGEFVEFGGEDDWEVVRRFLPVGWENKARELGALRRCRNFSGADALLRTLLIHLADGCSLRETVVRAHQGGLVSVSDVALLKRLKASGEWLRWMAERVMQDWIALQPSAVFGHEVRVRVIDGSIVSEPGKTGSQWRLHYSMRLPTLRCDEVHVTSRKAGETLKRFTVQQGDLFIADRGFAHRGGIRHVVDGGGDVLVRLNLQNVPLEDAHGNAFALLDKLRQLRGTRLGDWDVYISDDKWRFGGRVCALKKSQAAAEKARRKTLKENGKRHKVKPETIEAAGYIFVFTTLDRRFTPTTVLEMYRGRWQVELVFKRLKSIINLGHLKKTDAESSLAWLHGKLLVAFLIEAMIAAGDKFFPWGYPIASPGHAPTLPMPLAGDQLHA